MDKTITDAAGLLRQASDMLLSIEFPSSSSTLSSATVPVLAVDNEEGDTQFAHW